MLRRFKWRGQRDIEKDVLDGMGEINNRQDLIRIAEEEGLIGEVINWDKWDKLVQDTKELIHQLVEDDDDDYTPGNFKHVYAYDLLNGKLIGEFSSAIEASEKLNVNRGTIAHLCWKKRPYLKGKIYFSYTPVTREEVLKHSTKLDTNYNGSKPVRKYVYDLNGKLLGIFSSTQAVADKFNIETSAVNYYAWKKRPYWIKKLIILNRPMDEALKRSLDIPA